MQVGLVVLHASTALEPFLKPASVMSNARASPSDDMQATKDVN
jgi:hypothetical protein